MSYSKQRILVAQGQLRVAAVGYVLLGVPACTAIALSMLGTFFTLLFNGASFDLLGMGFWSGVAFFIGSLLVLAIALRARSQVRRGAPSFIPPVLTRLVPVLMGVGVAGALVLGGFARAFYVEKLKTDASNYCWTWEHKREFSSEACEEAARECLAARPIDEEQDAYARRVGMSSCMEARLVPSR